MQPVVSWFSFQGRMGRLGYWRAQLIGLVIASVIWVGGLLLATSTGVGAFSAIGLAGWPIALLIQVAALFRRLHDRNKSAWWLLIFYASPIAVSAMIQAPGSARMPPLLLILLALASLVIVVWCLVELGFLRGTRGPNKYGADPASA
jgi:uncharacterized membrane protein YhaH (DUF805 family)